MKSKISSFIYFCQQHMPQSFGSFSRSCLLALICWPLPGISLFSPTMVWEKTQTIYSRSVESIECQDCIFTLQGLSRKTTLVLNLQR